MRFLLFSLLAAAPAVLAQYGYDDSSTSTSSSAVAPSSSSTPSATGSSSGAIHTVIVGANSANLYSPNSLTAAINDQVEFHFAPITHSVSQASFDSPCKPLAGGTGFFSGGLKASSPSDNVFRITINDTNPIWFYCSVPMHCESGMVGVINPPSDGSETLAMFQSAAANVGSTVAPSAVQGGVIGPAKAQSSGTSISTSSTPASSSSSSSTSSSSPSPSASKSGAGIDARGNVQWVVLAVTGIIAVGLGRLMM